MYRNLKLESLFFFVCRSLCLSHAVAIIWSVDRSHALSLQHKRVTPCTLNFPNCKTRGDIQFWCFSVHTKREKQQQQQQQRAARTTKSSVELREACVYVNAFISATIAHTIHNKRTPTSFFSSSFELLSLSFRFFFVFSHTIEFIKCSFCQ